MTQPPITSFFPGQKRLLNNISDDKVTAVFDVSASEISSTNLSVSMATIHPLPPPLTPSKFLDSPVKLDPKEISERMTSGPPPLTPIKSLRITSSPTILHSPQRGINAPPNSPSKLLNMSLDGRIPVTKRLIFFPKQDVDDIFTSPVKLSEICSSPVKAQSSLVQNTVVKKLFGIAHIEEDNHEENINNELHSVPSYQKYAHLISTSTGEEKTKLYDCAEDGIIKSYAMDLPLPYKYAELLEIFRAVETVCSMFQNRSESITFPLLKGSVAKLLKSPLLQKTHLLQILTVLPNAYELKTDSTSDEKSQPSKLIISPNLHITNADSFSSETILQRRKLFQHNIIRICHKYHTEFLMSLDPPIVVPVGKTITRWHPRFQLDNVPDITISSKLLLRESYLQKLISSPIAQVIPTTLQNACERSTEKLISTKMAISNAQVILNRIKKIRTLDIANPNAKKKEFSLKSSLITSMKAKEKIYSKNISTQTLRGLSDTLLEKIKDREQAKCLQLMTLTPDQRSKREMLGELPHFVKILRNVMVLEKKSVILLNVVIERLSYSHRQPHSHKTVEAHIRLLQQILPEWLSIVRGIDGEYLKMDKGIDVNGIISQLQQIQQKTW